jgi:hypothetical protein
MNKPVKFIPYTDLTIEQAEQVAKTIDEPHKLLYVVGEDGKVQTALPQWKVNLMFTELNQE